MDVNGDMEIHINRTEAPDGLDKAHQIRTVVFVKEQKVPLEAEIDEYEKVSRHFLAEDDKHIPCGTARWRFTEKGIKLERFAVVKAFRRQGVGSALVRAILEDIAKFPGSKGQLIYLHAQLDAIPLYEKFGFEIIGDMFEECGIQHYEMTRRKGIPTAI